MPVDAGGAARASAAQSPYKGPYIVPMRTGTGERMLRQSHVRGADKESKMDGFHLSFVSMAFSDNQWQEDPAARAEQRRAELREQEEQYRRANLAGDSMRGQNRWRAALRAAVLALRPQLITMPRSDRTNPARLAPAVSETT